MDTKNSDSIRQKRRARCDEDEKWECSVCTYINSKESYKCEICFMRKGTSTRKPRPNPQVLEQQELIAQAILKEKDGEHRKKKSDRTYERVLAKDANIRLKNFDRSSPLLFEIFANGYSVVITEFPPKVKGKAAHFPDSPAASNCSSLLALSGTSAVPDQLSPTDSNSTSDAPGRAFPFPDTDFDGHDSKGKFSSNPPLKCVQSTSSKSRNVSNDRPSSLTLRASDGSHLLDATVKSSPLPQQPPDHLRSKQSTHRKQQRTMETKKRRRLAHKVPRSLGIRRVPSRLAKSTFRTSSLTSERFSSNDMKLVISSKRKRVGYTGDRPHLRAKRRKIDGSGPQANPKKRSTRLSTSQVDDKPDSNPHNLGESQSPSPQGSTPSSCKNVLTVKGVSSTPVELKCKIRVISPGVSELIPSGNSSREHSTEDHPRSSVSVERLASDTIDAIPTNPSRSSTESKNTSAMTDSAGAAALEIPD